MDFSNFRRFFGYRSSHFDNYDNYEDSGNSRQLFDNQFNDFENSSNDMFQQMDFMLDLMFSSFSFLGFPDFEEKSESFAILNGPSFCDQSPRSFMLKDENKCLSPSCQQQAESSGVDSNFNFGKKDSSEFYLDDESSEIAPKLQFSKLSSFKTLHLPDGTFEEHRTMVDSAGNKTTKIKRSIGNVSHEVVTKVNEKGIKETEENFVNMGEGEIDEFENKWKHIRSEKVSDSILKSSEDEIAIPSAGSYLDILKRFFGL